MESLESKNNEGKEREVAYEEYILYAEKVLDLREALPFPGLNEDSYQELKAISDEFPGMVTDIDVIISRFKDEGVKVVLWKNQQAFVLPFNSEINDKTIEDDSVLPRHLDASGEVGQNLKRLIEAGKQPHNRNAPDAAKLKK